MPTSLFTTALQVSPTLQPMARRLRWVLFVLACVVVAGEWVGGQNRAAPTDNVILITLDGTRVEEMFGGMNVDILRSTLRPEQKLEDSPIYRRFWAESPEARREKLMPFFWKTLMAQHGSIAGNTMLGSSVRLANRHRFSYPGYSEILLGEPHDDQIKSNDPIRNPYRTVLEAIREHLGVAPERVATIASWAHFNAIVESTEGATFVNAGQEALTPAAGHELLNALQLETPTPWSDMRYDSFTFRVAMAHLASSRPRALYLALGETDDWAHDGRYDRVLEAYVRTDALSGAALGLAGESAGL